MKRTLLLLVLVASMIGCNKEDISTYYECEDISTECKCENYVSVPPSSSDYAVPFKSNTQSIGEDWEINYEYLEGEYLFNCRYTGRPITPSDYKIVFGEEYISITIDWITPHSGVSHWIRDIEVKGSVLIINTLHLDRGFGFHMIGFQRLSAKVDRIYAPNVTEYKIVTRNIRVAPKELTVTIREEYMDRVVDMDFVPQDFGPLVSEINFSRHRQDFGIGRRLVVHYSGGGGADDIANRLFPQLEALPFVSERPMLGGGLGAGIGVRIIVSIAPEYNDRFDREQFALSDFNGISGIVSIMEYLHPHIRIWSQITLILQEHGTVNLNQLIDCVTNHNPYVETIDWINRYRIIYHYRNK